MVIYIVIAILIIAFLMRKKEGYFSGYYSFSGGSSKGEQCSVKDGVITCKEKGLFPAWFYPSYYGQGHFPTRYKRPGYTYRVIDGQRYRYNH